MSSEPAPVLIMAGGTGGHIMPALTVAGLLAEAGRPLVWLGSRHGLENRLVPERGIELYTLPVRGLRGKSLLRTLLAPLLLLAALFHALRLLRRLRPAVALGMGGFASAPGGIAAWLLRIPLVIHEQNAVAGLSNRLLAPLASRVFEAFPGSFPAGRHAECVGNPVRRELAELPPPEQRGIGRDRALRLLVLGGSQGARVLNQVVPGALARLSMPLEVLHQSGPAELEQTRRRYRELGIEAKVCGFIDDMAQAYAHADLAICRAGALTLSELQAVGLGSILVPFPHAVDDHQRRNAEHLVAGGAACLLPQAELGPESLAALIEGLCREPGRLAEMAARAREMARPEAGRRVAEACLELAR